MNNIADNIKSDLEQAYKIPIYVQQGLTNGEPSFLIGPYNSDRNLFDLEVEYSNQLRITINFVPELHGRMFIYNMGRQSAERRLLFLRYWDVLNQHKATVSVKINSNIVTHENLLMVWPEVFTDFKLTIMKFPLPEAHPFNYEETTLKWVKPTLGMILSLATLVPSDNIATQESFSGLPKFEGEKHLVLSNRYERNPLNRELCLAANGYRCSVCGMSFEEKYGIIGKGFIHVHHIIPLSMCGDKYQIDPVNDLVPVCPNCHAMLHKKNPPYTVNELREILKNNNST